MSSDTVDLVPRAEGHVSPFGRAVEAMHVTATAADGRLRAEMRGWYAVRVDVEHGYAERADDTQLARHVAGLARLLFVARTREYYRLMEEHLQPDPVVLRRQREGLASDVEDRQAGGEAAGGAVRVTTIGMKHFIVEIEPGTGARLGSEGLGQALTSTANDMVTQWRQVLAERKREKWSR